MDVTCTHMHKSLVYIRAPEETDLSKCVPLILHGDDAECHRRRSFTVVSFASVTIGHCSPFESLYILYCMDVNRSCDSTLDQLDSWLMWSFCELLDGRWSHKGPWSQDVERRSNMTGEIADVYRGILTFHRGDEKYMAKAYHMRVTWLSHQVCWRCKASRTAGSENLYTYHGRGAPRRETMIGLEEFVADTCAPNCWIQMPGFDPSMIFFDFLHVFDLTIVADAAANVPLQYYACVHARPIDRYKGKTVSVPKALIELSETNAVWPGSTPDERLRYAHVEFSRLCKQHKVRRLD